MDFEAALRETRVVPVVEIARAADAVPLAEALLAGGLPCAEITFRTAAAGAAIAAIAAAMPDFLVGAGTVLSVAQAEEALASGARFLVAPSFDADVVDFAREQDIPMLPGVCTPTEIARALADGLSVVKLFPAEAAGGVGYLKAVAAPFGGVRFVPTGGIGPDNLSAYLAHPQVLACGGSWMVKKQTIAAGDFAAITADAAAAVALAASARPQGVPA
jgi:2-dehydro-3-deoxyphosphogluconate aldolase / (4S)-4-hydroxy-2-oxoglutarate aldolase